jgi:hypothetical protein
MAEQLDIETPTIDEILSWAQNVRDERIIESHKLVADSFDLNKLYQTGIPTVYGFNSITECID